MDLLLDLFKGTLDPLSVGVDRGCLLVEVLLVGIDLGMSILDFSSYVMGHSCSEVHLKLSERDFAAVEAEDLDRDELASRVIVEILVDLIDELEALPFVLLLCLGTHSSFLVSCFAKKFLEGQELHFCRQN